MGELDEPGRRGGSGGYYILIQGDASSRNTGSGDCGFWRLRVSDTTVLETRPKDGFPASVYNMYRAHTHSLETSVAPEQIQFI